MFNRDVSEVFDIAVGGTARRTLWSNMQCLPVGRSRLLPVMGKSFMLHLNLKRLFLAETPFFFLGEYFIFGDMEINMEEHWENNISWFNGRVFGDLLDDPGLKRIYWLVVFLVTRSINADWKNPGVVGKFCLCYIQIYSFF